MKVGFGRKKKISKNFEVEDEKSVLLPKLTNWGEEMTYVYAIVSNNTFIAAFPNTILTFDRDSCKTTIKKIEKSYKLLLRGSVDDQRPIMYYKALPENDSSFIKIIRTDGETLEEKNVLQRQLPYRLYIMGSWMHLTSKGTLYVKVRDCRSCDGLKFPDKKDYIHSMIKIDMFNENVNVDYCEMEYYHDMFLLTITDSYVYYHQFFEEKDKSTYVLKLVAQDMNNYTDKWIKY